MIAIIDYGSGNVGSVKNALDYLGYTSVITHDKEIIKNADRVVFPGQGMFGDVMRNLEEKKLITPIIDFISSGKPFLGICIGMQVLFDSSEESPEQKGLGILKGKVIKFRKGKIPQIGWNKIKSKTYVYPSSYFGSYLGDYLDENYMYFANSYYVVPDDKEIIAGETDYNIVFASAIIRKNVAGFQFHPEKSGKDGLKLLKKWLEDAMRTN